MAKTWTDRLNAADEPKLKASPRAVGDVVEGQLMLVPTACRVDDLMRTPTTERLIFGTEFVRAGRRAEGLED